MVRDYRRKRHYSTLQRILVHLSSPTSSDPTHPATLTQEGIAEVILSGRSTVTKCLAELAKRGLVIGERTLVPQRRVRKTVYRLTTRGWETASQLRGRLATDIVEVRAPDLSTVSMKVSDIPKFFPTRVDLTMAVCLASERRLDLTRVPETRPGPGSSLVWGDALRRPDRLIGRQPETRTLNAWRSSSSPILLVSGLAGIGKSSLVADWILEHRRGAHVFWHEVHETTAPVTFLADFAAFLARLGRRGLASSLSEPNGVDLRYAMRALEHEMRGLSVLMILDNLERARPETKSFLTGPILRLAGARTKIVLISRTLPRLGFPPVDVLQLKGLEPRDSVALLRSRGLHADEAKMMDIATSSRGHPLLLSLAAQGGTVKKGSVQRYFEEEIRGRLSRAELVSLEAASIFRRAAPVRALESIPGVTELALADLRMKNLLEPTLAGGLVVHDLIREHMAGQLDERRFRYLHRQAAKYFLRMHDARERLEGLYHLLRAGRVRAAANLLDRKDVSLLDSVPVHAIAPLLRGIDIGSVNPACACVFSECLGDSLRINGDLRPALMQYGHAVRRCETAKRLERIPRLLRKMASIERCRGNYPKALGYLVEARARLSRHPDPAELAEVLRELALVEQARGNLSNASAHLNESVDLATEVSDSGSLVRGLLALGTLEAQRGHRELSLDYKLEGQRIAESRGNLTEMARSCIAVGTAYAELGRLEESLRQHERGERLARLVGNLRLMAYATKNRSAALLDLGRYQEAGRPLHDAMRLFELVEERDKVALLCIYEGQREMGLGHWTRAKRIWDRGLRAFRDLGAPYDLARALKEVGVFHVDHGEIAEGRVFLTGAKTIADELGNATLLAEIEARLAALDARETRLDETTSEGTV